MHCLSKKEPAGGRDALRFLSEALRKDEAWLSIAREDPDLASIRTLPAFQRVTSGDSRRSYALGPK